MRALLVLLAACSPEINSGSYFCGANSSCPPDEACNGPDNRCVLKGSEMAFECPLHALPAGTSIQDAYMLPALTCSGQAFEASGCVTADQPGRWVKLTTPATCSSVAVQVQITFPIAFEPLVAQLWDADANQMIGASASCSPQVPGDSAQCIMMTVMTGHSYAIEITPAGGGDCSGACAFNGYDLSVALPTPG